jgi:hypothetical protein
MIAMLLHGEYGWPGFAFAALLALAMCFAFNQLAKASLKKLNRNRGRHRKSLQKTRHS